MHDVSTAIAIGFVEQSKRLRAAHYRSEAERFRGMAETEPLRKRVRTYGRRMRRTAFAKSSRAALIPISAWTRDGIAGGVRCSPRRKAPDYSR